jgi:hypothetical protein
MGYVGLWSGRERGKGEGEIGIWADWKWRCMVVHWWSLAGWKALLPDAVLVREAAGKAVLCCTILYSADFETIN